MLHQNSPCSTFLLVGAEFGTVPFSIKKKKSFLLEFLFQDSGPAVNNRMVIQFAIFYLIFNLN